MTDALEKALDYDERIILSPARKAEIEEQLSKAKKIDMHRCGASSA